ncbi:MAG: GNAT family N-acetyltransferase [Odoribacteraceae bacterium]|jgi:GNAT superfamily N-acetyltransferase|nr:GNAT family N-acetyltransferase [Odoribacteraceae bacterium]
MRPGDDATRAGVMELWHLCFGDTREFIRFYFNAKYRAGNTFVHRDARGTIVAALQMVPYRMTYAGRTVAISYLSGACTRPERRGEGIMSRLLTGALLEMQARGVALCALIPGEERLFHYYGRMGFVPVFDYRAVEWTGDGEGAAREVGPGDEAMEAVYRYFQARMLERGCCVQHDREDFSAIVEELLASGGALPVAFTAAGAVEGVAFAVPVEDRVVVKEHACDSPAARRALSRALSGRWPGRRQEWREVPLAGPVVHHGMARVTDAGALLRAYAAHYPGERQTIRVTDALLPANDGRFEIRGGRCRRAGRSAGAADAGVDAGELTRRLLTRFPGHPPHMSLMLE